MSGSSTSTIVMILVQYLKQMELNICGPLALVHLCGHLAVNNMVYYQTWTIKSLLGYNTMILFHRLEMMYSQSCEINSLTLLRTSHCKHVESYCGYLPPWNESCPSLTTKITLAIGCLKYKTEVNISYFISRDSKVTVTKTIWLTGTYAEIFFQEFALTLYLQQNANIKQLTSIFIYARHQDLIHFGIKNISDAGSNDNISGKYIKYILLYVWHVIP